MATDKQLKYWASMKGHRGHFLGKKHSIETKEKMREARIGIVFTTEHRRNLSISHKGIKQNISDDLRKKRHDRFIGENNPRWKGGVSKTQEYKNFLQRRRDVSKRANGGSHSLIEWQELKKFYNFMCLCCKQQEPFIKLTEDHIVPIACGGSDNIDNIQPLCRSCNSRKLITVMDYRVLIANKT